MTAANVTVVLFSILREVNVVGRPTQTIPRSPRARRAAEPLPAPGLVPRCSSTGSTEPDLLPVGVWLCTASNLWGILLYLQCFCAGFP